MAPNAAENVRVVVRVRPMTNAEDARGDEELVQCASEKALQVTDPNQQRGSRANTALKYSFEQCFGTRTSQDELFKQSGVATLLDHVCDGYSATVFAYGPTGSGKTYTISGKPDSIIKHGSGDASDGIVIRSIESLYEKVRALQRDGLQFKVRASCVEIYNESVIDLVRFSRQSKGVETLPVKFDTSRGSFFVHDLSYGKCPSEEELLRLYMKTLRNRSVASHELNRDSSRSHALFTIYVDSMVRGPDGHIVTRHGKMSFVDLAGSERLKDSKSEGSTLRETGSINKSLFTLGKVISSLCDRKKVKVPFRDSKLTQLLMDSIGGKSLTVMLTCVSPASSHIQETVRTLDYAHRAKSIQNKPVVLLDPQENMVDALRKEIENLRAENKALKDALESSGVPLHAVPGVSASMQLPVAHRHDRSAPSGTGRASSDAVLEGGGGGGGRSVSAGRTERIVAQPTATQRGEQGTSAGSTARAQHPGAGRGGAERAAVAVPRVEAERESGALDGPGFHVLNGAGGRGGGGQPAGAGAEAGGHRGGMEEAPYQRRVIANDRNRSQSRSGGRAQSRDRAGSGDWWAGAGGGKGGGSEMSELKELEKLSKFSYFKETEASPRGGVHARSNVQPTHLRKQQLEQQGRRLSPSSHLALQPQPLLAMSSEDQWRHRLLHKTPAGYKPDTAPPDDSYSAIMQSAHAIQATRQPARPGPDSAPAVPRGQSGGGAESAGARGGSAGGPDPRSVARTESWQSELQRMIEEVKAHSRPGSQNQVEGVGPDAAAHKRPVQDFMAASSRGGGIPERESGEGSNSRSASNQKERPRSTGRPPSVPRSRGEGGGRGSGEGGRDLDLVRREEEERRERILQEELQALQHHPHAPSAQQTQSRDLLNPARERSRDLVGQHAYAAAVDAYSRPDPALYHHTAPNSYSQHNGSGVDGQYRGYAHPDGSGGYGGSNGVRESLEEAVPLISSFRRQSSQALRHGVFQTRVSSASSAASNASAPPNAEYAPVQPAPPPPALGVGPGGLSAAGASGTLERALASYQQMWNAGPAMPAAKPANRQSNGRGNSSRHTSPYRHSSPYGSSGRRPSAKSNPSPRRSAPSPKTHRPSPRWDDSAPLHPQPRATSGALHSTWDASPSKHRGGSSGGGRGGGAQGGGGAEGGTSYDALMRDLEESRRRAEVARQNIMARKAQWESDFLR